MEHDRISAALESVGVPDSISLDRLQEEVAAWAAKNFPSAEPYYPLLGVVGEVGELAHAHLKALQGIRGTPAEHEAEKVDAVGDAMIYLADYCGRNGLSLAVAVAETWARVKNRDWKKDPKNGNEIAGAR